jgi:hypothetical protein
LRFQRSISYAKRFSVSPKIFWYTSDRFRENAVPDHKAQNRGSRYRSRASLPKERAFMRRAPRNVSAQLLGSPVRQRRLFRLRVFLISDAETNGIDPLRSIFSFPSVCTLFAPACGIDCGLHANSMRHLDQGDEHVLRERDSPAERGVVSLFKQVRSTFLTFF